MPTPEETAAFQARVRAFEASEREEHTLIRDSGYVFIEDPLLNEQYIGTREVSRVGVRRPTELTEVAPETVGSLEVRAASGKRYRLPPGLKSWRDALDPDTGERLIPNEADPVASQQRRINAGLAEPPV